LRNKLVEKEEELENMREIAFKDEDLQGTPLELKSGQKEYEELEK